MGLVVLITLSAYVILDYMVPYAKNTKWIENASNAYYNAYWWIELALEHIKTRPNLTTETWSTMPWITTPIWKSYSTSSSWMQIPKPWEWNSEYDKDFNTISRYEPIQLEVWAKNTKIYDIDWSKNWIIFNFKVPNNLWDLKWDNILNILLSNENDTWYSSWIAIETQDIQNITDIWLVTINWTTLGWTGKDFQSIHDLWCNWTNSWCILKISVINKLELINWNIIPYLEWRINKWATSSTNYILPDRYTTITSWGKSYMYRKDLKVKVPQQTVNQALDFTVFQ